MATELKSWRRLLKALEALSEPTAASAFVLLWTWFREVGLGSVENALRARGEHPSKLEQYPQKSAARKNDPRAPIRRLGELVDRGEEFDVLALRWLKGLDLYLKDRLPEMLAGEFRGIDGQIWRLRRCNNLIANHYRGQRQGTRTWAAHESAAIELYARHHTAVPTRPIAGLELAIVTEDAWGSPSLHERLRRERRRLRVMSWPLRTEIEYAGVSRNPRPAAGDRADPEFVSLRRVANEAELSAELREAVEVARREQVTILILPELAVPENLERELGRTLAENGTRGYPVLTLLGCCHRPNAAGRLDLNEASLLGPDGRELHRHRKLAAFTAAQGWAEKIEVAEKVTVLESCLGNLVPLICLDFFHAAVGQRIEGSHANLFLVPSLSPKTTPHADAARQLRAKRLASSFVCNRRFGPQPSHDDPEGTSFYLVPRSSRSYVAHFEEGGRKITPYLLFEL